jgi:acyl transferase domain-containing protein/acyl carrier protein
VTEDAVAIVGMSCRFPGVLDLGQYWNVLEQERDTVTRGLSGGSAPEAGLQPVDAFGVLSDIECFDNTVFGVTPREATMMDPQQRIWLELVWHALEDAGLGDRRDLVTGVFAGSNRSAYLEQNIMADAGMACRLRKHASSETRQTRNGNERDFLPLRTSYALDLDGPSVNVQTACSTGLVSVAMACASLGQRATDVCVAGAISIARTTCDPVHVEPEAIHSTSGFCRPFGETADGTVFGDGGGVVVLRRLADAIADRQRVYCVVRGWGVSNDGGSKPSFLAPDAHGQARAIRAAWRMASIDPKLVSYVEAHGTGTKVGDPIEFEGLVDGLGGNGATCRIGSVKANIGHTDTAAGIAGLIKTALMIFRRRIVAMPGVARPGPLVGVEDTRFELATHGERWVTAHDGPKYAGVTSLGVGGTNCHLALSEAPDSVVSQGTEDFSPGLLLVSAADEDALDRQLASYIKALSNAGDDVADLCLMSIQGRRHLRHRVATIGRDTAELARKLADARARSRHGRPPVKPRILFGFTGQLSSYSGVAREHYQRDGTFARTIDECARILDSELDRSLGDILFEPGDSLSRTCYEQPALCALQIALSEMWISLGIRPSASLGYSVGEFAAACVSGAAPLGPLLRFVARRGAIMEGISEPGYMAAIRAPSDAIEDFCARSPTEVAGRPAPGLTVVAGRGTPDKVASEFPQPGAVKVLSDRYGFHSEWIDPCLDALRTAAEAVPWQTPRVPVASSLSGALLHEFSPDYWVAHARSPVLFREALESASVAGATLALEIGPKPVLTNLASETDAGISWLPSLSGAESDWDSHLTCLSKLFEAGAEPDWKIRFPRKPRTWVDLPKYSFSRKTFWTGPRPSLPSVRETASISETWTEANQPHLCQHRIFDRIVVPASHHVSWILDRLTDHFGHSHFVICDWVFHHPAVMPKDAELRIALRLSGKSPGEEVLDLALHEDGMEQKPFVTARVELQRHEMYGTLDTAALDKAFPAVRDGDRFYRESWVNLEGTGERFRLIDRIWHSKDRAVAKIRRCERSMSYAPPAEVIEAAFQCLHAATEIETRAARDDGELWVPYSIGRVAFRPSGPSGLSWCSVVHQARKRTATNAVADVALYGQTGNRLVEILGFHLRPIRKEALETSRGELPCYETTLEPASPLPIESVPQMPVAWRWERDGVLALIGERLESARADVSSELDELLVKVNAHKAPVRLAFLSSSQADPAMASASRFLRIVRSVGETSAHIECFCISQPWQAGFPMPEGAAVEALARVAMNEYPDWNVRLIAQDAPDGERRWRELLSEMKSGTGQRIAWLSGQRYRRELRSIDLPATPARLSDAKSYLVIGPDNAQSRGLRDWLSRSGAGRVHYLRGDESVPDAISGTIAEASEHLPLGGLFFLPWGAGEELIARLPNAEFEARVRECITALDAVWQAVGDVELDHFVCFSSSAAVLGVQGQASYAAMTGWMDAFCVERRRMGMPGLAINWGPWEGMGHWTQTAKGRQAVSEQGWRPISPEVGFDTLSRAMAGDRAQVHVIPVDWSKLGAYADTRLASAVPALLGLDATDETPLSELSRLIGEDVGGFPKETTLVELGLDSMMAVRLRNFLKVTYGKVVPLVELLSTLTLEDIAELTAVDEELGE